MTFRQVTCGAIGIVLIAHCAMADDFPMAFQVTGVDATDVLNIRAKPTTESAILGSIGPYGMNVEVLQLSNDGKWGQVGMPEGNGWVAMRFLEPIQQDASYIPRPLTCTGTEPFWSISLYPRGAEYNSPDTGAVAMSVAQERTAPQGYLFTVEEGPTLSRTLIVSREECSDGMSDRRFGFSAKVFVDAPDGNAVLSGCCTLDHR